MTIDLSWQRRGFNILFVGTLPPHPGGSAISCAQLLAGLADLGHTVRALAPITGAALQSGDSFAVKNPGISVTRFLVPYFEIAPSIPAPDDYRRLEAEQLREMLRALLLRERPDFLLVGRESFAWDVPEIARVHSLSCIMLVRGGSRTAAILDRTYPQNLARQLLGEYGKADLIITVAEHLTDGLRQLGLSNVKTIPNAVDLQQFAPRAKDEALLHELAIGPDDTVVMHVANLQARKRSLDLVSAAAKALRHNPKLVYVIVGDGSLRQAMEDACCQKHIGEKFRFVGWVDYHHVPVYINLADLVLMPSEAEGLARVYLETQACARVILASDIAAAREVIVDGETGLMFRKGDIDDLTKKTLLAAGDAGLRASIGRKAWEHVQKHHSLDQALAAYVTTFHAITETYHEL